MNNNFSKLVSIVGCLTVIITILFYFLIFDDVFGTDIIWLSLLCILFTEAISTIKILKLSKNVLGMAHTTVSLIHISVLVITSYIFIHTLSLQLGRYFVLNFIFFVLVAMVDASIYYFNKQNKESYLKYENGSMTVDELLTKTQELTLQFGGTTYKNDFHTIIESLKYSNRSDLYGNEKEILTKLQEIQKKLEQEEPVDVTDILKEIKDMIQLRNMGLKKSGSF